jgi:cytochrome c-type biogenesis protein CcmH
MITAFVLVAALIAVLVAVWVVLPLIVKRGDASPSAPYAALGATAGLLVAGGAFYVALSNFNWSQAPASAADSPQTMVASLARRLEREPDDLNGWLMLGRSYAVLEQFPLAARAYQRADRLADGRNAEALTGLAEALAMQDQNELEGRAGRLFEKALELDPTSGKALFFTGATAMRRGDLPLARERFSRLLALEPPDNVKSILEQQLAVIDAQMRGLPAANGAAPAAGAPATAAQAPAAAVRVRVSLGPRIDRSILRATPLFVFVREPGVPGPPLAVKRLVASFPAEVVLTGQDAMLEGRAIAAGQQVEVVARLAQGGAPNATSGDPFGSVRYHVGKDGVVDLVIDQVTP